jgi:hypothetical protein
MRVMSLIGGAGGAVDGGGTGVGGGMKVGSRVISGFLDDCSLTLTDSTLVGNQAVGCAGGSGNRCSAGQGAGLAVLAGSSASISSTSIVLNAALGGLAGTGDTSGQGQGDGVYIGTTADSTLDTWTLVLLNFASTSPGFRTPGDPHETTGANTSAMRAGFWIVCCLIHESALCTWARPSSPPRISPKRRREAAA